MKKNNLWKAIGICFLAYVVLSWIIPTGTFSSGILSKGSTAPLGLLDLIRYPLVTASTSLFVLTALVILLIGGFYGVLNQTGAYAKVVNGIVTKFKEKGNTFLVISILVFTVLASLTALTTPLLVMVPFFVTVILSLGYSKIVALLSTVGAILVGNMGSTYGFNINGYLTFFFKTGINDTIVTRILFFLVVTAILVAFVLYLAGKTKVVEKKTGKKNTKKEQAVLEIPLYENKEEKEKSAVPLVVISIIMMVLVLVGMYNWETGLKVTFFTDIYTSITEFEISGYPIFKNIIGSIDPMGYWTGYELAIILFLATLLIAWIYNVKGSEKWQAFVNGVKQMVPVAIYTIAASILFLLMNANSTGASFFDTIANFFITLTKGFNVISFGLLTAIGGVFYNDFPYFINALYDPITSLYTNYGVIGLLTQMVHGFVMLIAPTSVVLVAGLSYLNISYTEWFKNIWKFLLLALAAIVIFVIILLLVG